MNNGTFNSYNITCKCIVQHVQCIVQHVHALYNMYNMYMHCTTCTCIVQHVHALYNMYNALYNTKITLANEIDTVTLQIIRT